MRRGPEGRQGARTQNHTGVDGVPPRMLVVLRTKGWVRAVGITRRAVNR